MNAIEGVKDAKLPKVYERAKEALERCVEIDECKEWKDKAAAIASYAKQADDEDLYKNAMRIKGRAVRRMAEIAREVEPKTGRPKKGVSQEPPFPTGARAALIAAGLSEQQAKQTLRVGEIPATKFEKLIESDEPPTVTELAAMGRKPAKKVIDITGGRNSDEFKAAVRIQGRLRDLVEQIEATTPAEAARGALDHDRQKFAANARIASKWLSKVESELSKKVKKT